MSRYKVDNLVRLYVEADDPETAQIIARNALERAVDNEAVTSVYADPRYSHARALTWGEQ